jgi:predicted Rossmann fold nucleotide-binding protein DprA/Smf involved in DNA uptake
MERDKIQKAGHKIIAVVGNSEGWYLQEILEEVEKLKMITKDDMIVSGGADGVDVFAQIYAKRHGIPIIILYPDPEKQSPEKFYERNRKIVELADEIIAFNKKGEKGGTAYTIKYAKKLGKNVIVCKK